MENLKLDVDQWNSCVIKYSCHQPQLGLLLETLLPRKLDYLIKYQYPVSIKIPILVDFEITSILNIPKQRLWPSIRFHDTLKKMSWHL